MLLTTFSEVIHRLVAIDRSLYNNTGRHIDAAVIRGCVALFLQTPEPYRCTLEWAEDNKLRAIWCARDRDERLEITGA